MQHVPTENIAGVRDPFWMADAGVVTTMHVYSIEKARLAFRSEFFFMGDI